MGLVEKLVKGKKPSRTERIRENQRKGRAGEKWAAIQHQVQGDEVIRTGRGHDFKVRKKDIPFIGKTKRTIYLEVKTGPSAKLSPLQKIMKKKLKGRFRVHRQDDAPDI